MVWSQKMRVSTGLALGLVLVALVAAAYWYYALPPTARVVQEVLKMRSREVAVAADYQPYFESTSVAQALAADAAKRKSDRSPIPRWRRPEALLTRKNSAKVRVRWVNSKEFPDWPRESIFFLERRDDSWLIVDATETSKESSASAAE